MTVQPSRPFYGEYAWAFDLAGERSSDYRFVMRCWTRTELESVFERGGFGSVAYFCAYNPAVHAEATDRLVAVAQLSDVS